MAQAVPIVGGMAAVAGFIYAKLAYWVPDGYLGLLYNPTSDAIENYIMYPGIHFRVSLKDTPLYMKNADPNLYKTQVTDCPTADKRGKKEDPNVTGVTADVKVLYKLVPKEAPNLYRDYGDDDKYPKEVFAEGVDKCVKGITAQYKLADYIKNLETNEKFLRDDLSKCIADETKLRYVTITWAQITRIDKAAKQ